MGSGVKEHKLEGHVADTRLRVRGSSLEELFEAAFLGLGELVKSEQPNGDLDVVETFEISASDTTSLLIDFLSEVLSMTHVNRAVFYVVDFEELTETWVRATIRGRRVESFDKDVKAVTYHEAAVKKDKDGNFESVIVLDI